VNPVNVPNPADQMVWTMARQCRPGDVAVVGVATPMAMVAVQLARAMLVPDLTILVGTAVAPSTFDVGAATLDPTVPARLASGILGQYEILDLIQRGGVTIQFVSPAQIDGNGHINVSRVPGGDGRLRRLPGPLALPDVARLVGRLVAYRAEHSSRFLVDRVAYVTGDGARVAAIVTDKALLVRDGGGGGGGGSGFRVESVHAGASADEVRDGCGFELAAIGDPADTEPPPGEALELLDTVIDPLGSRHLETRAGRPAAMERLAAAGAAATS
jgi:glutaconate CoA-transferase subunit B